MILHHFEASPFSEKIRSIFGYKALAWQSVLIPRTLPKPELTALTGGYRKTPVLQIGRDLYFDTRLIARVIERLVPAPVLCPAAEAASIEGLERFADQRLFLAAIPVLFRPPGRAHLAEKLGEDYLARFVADRGDLFSGGSVGRPDDAFSRAVWQPALARLDAQLAARDFLLGDTPTLADFAVYHPVWYVRANPGVAETVERFTALTAWADRMAAIGHGKREDIPAEQARRVVYETTGWQPLPEPVDEPNAISPGTAVTLGASDYGVERVAGQLVALGREEIVVTRTGPDATPVRVHAPREGFELRPAAD